MILCTCTTSKETQKKRSFDSVLIQLPVNSSVLKSNDKVILHAMFYALNDNSQFLRIYETICTLPTEIRGFYELDKFIIIYEGIEDSLSMKYINIEKSDWQKFASRYKVSPPCMECESEPNKMIINEYHYRIIDGRFELFIPDEKHMREYEKKLILEGIIKLPPLPPRTGSIE
ncbi:hypothetical protein D0T85_12700 [Bacteroides sp. 519]|nr:hypothetical protein [Bacteroides sp. 519]